jgi:hypothetical protein
MSTLAQLRTAISNIKSLISSDGKVDAAELQQVLTDMVNALGTGQSKTFSAAIDFVDDTSFMTHSVTGAINFTRVTTGALPGSVTVVRLTANGSNAPTFDTAFKRSSGSQAYTNTNGIVNMIYFWHDGTDYWYSIDKAA